MDSRNYSSKPATNSWTSKKSGGGIKRIDSGKAKTASKESASTKPLKQKTSIDPTNNNNRNTNLDYKSKKFKNRFKKKSNSTNIVMNIGGQSCRLTPLSDNEDEEGDEDDIEINSSMLDCEDELEEDQV